MSNVVSLRSLGATTSFRQIPFGEKSDAVRQLQTNLMSWGFDPGTADGIFGPKTQAAVQALQLALGVPKSPDYTISTQMAVASDLASPSSKLRANQQRLNTPIAVPVPPGNTNTPTGPTAVLNVAPSKSKAFVPILLGGGALALFVMALIGSKGSQVREAPAGVGSYLDDEEDDPYARPGSRFEEDEDPVKAILRDEKRKRIMTKKQKQVKSQRSSFEESRWVVDMVRDLNKAGVSNDQIATETGADANTVEAWADGAARPSAVQRSKLVPLLAKVLADATNS